MTLQAEKDKINERLDHHMVAAEYEMLSEDLKIKDLIIKQLKEERVRTIHNAVKK